MPARLSRYPHFKLTTWILSIGTSVRGPIELRAKLFHARRGSAPSSVMIVPELSSLRLEIIFSVTVLTHYLELDGTNKSRRHQP
jgi:hypothetical protein